jgi:hypothetical protein
LGQNWFDCVAYGTYTQVQAGKACQAWVQATGATASCASNCSGKAMCSAGGGGKPGACWGYSGDVIGNVYQGTGQFICPLPSDPFWDP